MDDVLLYLIRAIATYLHHASPQLLALTLLQAAQGCAFPYSKYNAVFSLWGCLGTEGGDGNSDHYK